MTNPQLTDYSPMSNSELDAIPRTMAWRISELEPGTTVEMHRHRRAQLLYACAGVMTVTTRSGIWVVPPHRAVWVPEKRDHAVHANTTLSLRNLYINTSQVPGLPEDLCVVAVPGLLRELILEMVTTSAVLYDENGPEGRLVNVVLDRIKSLDIVPLHLPLPDNKSTGRIAKLMMENPADNRSIDEWASQIGASGRTLARRFISETGMSFGQWRQQARLLEAMRLLADGVPVTTVSLELGYGNQSAFIAMFKKAVGKTPGKYFEP